MNQPTNASEETETPTNENDIKIEPMPFADETIGDSDFSGDQAQSSDSFQCHDDFLYHSRDKQNGSQAKHLPSQQSPRRKDPHRHRAAENVDAIERNSGHTSKSTHTEQPLHSQQLPSDSDFYRTKFLKFLEQGCIPEAQRVSNDNNQASSERYEFEKMCRLKEIDLKRMEIESNERIRLMQLEKEERVEKFKLELDFKLEMAKLEHTKVNQF